MSADDYGKSTHVLTVEESVVLSDQSSSVSRDVAVLNSLGYPQELKRVSLLPYSYHNSGCLSPQS